MKTADKYALICQEIAQLTIERDKLREELLAMKQEFIAGDQCDIVINSRDTITLDPKAVYDMLKPSRFFQIVSVKSAEAKKILSEEQFAKATKSIKSADVVNVKTKIAAIA